MPKLVHLALAHDGTVVAQFAIAEHAAEFCRSHDCCHVPYNLANRDLEPAPAVGSVYRA